MPNILLEGALKLFADVGMHIADSALRILLIIVVGYIISKVLRVAVRHLEAVLIRLGEGSDDVPGATRKRVATLMNVIRTIAVVVTWSVVVGLTLEQIGFAVGPILAAAGMVGLAVGFGAQNLVRDVISGFFIILENQIRIGDVAIINGTGGLVEAVTFRTVVLR